MRTPHLDPKRMVGKHVRYAPIVPPDNSKPRRAVQYGQEGVVMAAKACHHPEGYYLITCEVAILDDAGVPTQKFMAYEGDLEVLIEI